MTDVNRYRSELGYHYGALAEQSGLHGRFHSATLIHRLLFIPKNFVASSGPVAHLPAGVAGDILETRCEVT